MKIALAASLLLAIPTAACAAEDRAWTIEEFTKNNEYPSVEYNFNILNLNTTTPFDHIRLKCSNEPNGVTFEVMYNNGKYAKLAVKHGSEKKIFERTSGNYYGISGPAAIELDKFLSSTQDGNYKFEFEPVDPDNRGRYAVSSVADMSNYEAAKKVEIENCAKQQIEYDNTFGKAEKERELRDQQEAKMAIERNNNDLIGVWTLGGVGGSSLLAVKPNGQFSFSYVQSFSHQKVIVNGSWHSSDKKVSFDQGSGRGVTKCQYVGSHNVKYLAGCALAGVMNRVQ